MMRHIFKTIALSILLLFPVVVSGKKEKPLLRAGILSDVHVSEAKADSVFIKALEYFKGRDIDVMILAGDFTNDGTEDQLANIAKDWFMVFPDDKGRRGKHVERVFIYGNHEMEGTTYKEALNRHSQEYLDGHRISDHCAEYWEKYWKEPYAPFYHKVVNGYDFIASQYVDRAEAPGMKEYFDSLSPSLPKDRPIFYVQHKHPKWTVNIATDNGNSTRVLKDYPNLICFSGHCHTSLTDELSIWQGKFTCVNTASLRRVGAKSGRENTKPKDPAYVPQMQMMWCGNGHQGIYMEVFSDRVDLHRYDFHYDEELGVWSIPNDVTLRPYSVDARKAAGALNPPQFPSNASIQVKFALSKDRNKQPSQQVQILFPAVVSHDGHPRAYDYEIVAEVQEGGSFRAFSTKYVFSSNFHHSERADQSKPARCHFAESELPKGVGIRFAIRPRDSFGNLGDAVFSKIIEL